MSITIPTPLFHHLSEITLCEEAIFQFLASPPLASVPVEHLSESLPGRKVDWKSVERLKKSCSPQQQALHLLRLWREQNKDQDKLLSIIQGVNHCERKVSRCASVKNLTLEDLLLLMDSLPGEKVSDEDVRALVNTCPSQRYILQLLHLWKIQNGGHGAELKMIASEGRGESKDQVSIDQDVEDVWDMYESGVQIRHNTNTLHLQYDLHILVGKDGWSQSAKLLVLEDRQRVGTGLRGHGAELKRLMTIASEGRGESKDQVSINQKYCNVEHHLALVLMLLSHMDASTVEVPTYQHEDPLIRQILTCTRCPAGTHMRAHCTASEDTVCSSCPKDHFTQFWNYLPKCLYCSTFCVENQYIKKECSPTNNRVCQCKEGYYWQADFCIKHTECPSGYGVQQNAVVGKFREEKARSAAFRTCIPLRSESGPRQPGGPGPSRAEAQRQGQKSSVAAQVPPPPRSKLQKQRDARRKKQDLREVIEHSCEGDCTPALAPSSSASWGIFWILLTCSGASNS
ncbi:Tumor necrosis factor receptor superfamily member 11B [Anabarilius grahami]|uniref:Tumor necrosis factor receptor superfamily member 11B n=1 Tax=Anabarilius grahami TaxID=495550 RepID=A0A3N0Y795_ANAGA|nr:Tumor necrosis factor receptor superfamily member 11B [Anabarilius grahami]